MSSGLKTPLSFHEQLIKGLEAKILSIKSTMSPIYNNREQKMIRRLEKELKRIKSLK